MKNRKINILGTQYSLVFDDSETDSMFENALGYCDDTSKKIAIDTSPQDAGDQAAQQRRIVRHELIHAFLSESGLGDSAEWAVSEETVDWIARQFPKLAKTFNFLDVAD